MNTPPPTAAVVSPSRTTYQAILSQRWRLRHSAMAQPGSNTSGVSISSPTSRLSLAGLFQLEFYARGMAVPVERYAEPAGGWLTIGGGPGPGGAKHAGGTPVKLGPGGTIEAGPKSLEGKPISSISSPSSTAKTSTESKRPEWESLLNRTGVAEANGVKARIVPKEGMVGAWVAEVTQGGETRQIDPGDGQDYGWGSAKDNALKAMEDTAPMTAKQQTTLFNAISPKKREKKPGTGPPKREQETLFDKGKPEEKSATPEPPANPYVVRNADGRNVGMALLPIDQVQADPTAFQYKFSEVTDKTTGTTAELKDVKQFNPLYAGQMLVWDDGEGNTFVVNGHHRYELAKRSGYTGPLNVQYIDATDVHEAKAIGALANIAEGKGTAIDAAKFLRDTKRSVADIVESGISLKGKVAADAQHLVNASNNVWRELEMGYLPEDKALIITRALPDDHDSQNKLLKRLNVRDSKRLMGNGILQEAADAMAAAPVVKKGAAGRILFDDDEEEERLWEQRAIAADYVKRMMSEEKMAWKGVSKEGRAETVAAAGNVLQLPENQRRAQESAAAEMMFNQLKNRKGPLAEVLNDAAKQLHENPRRKKSILKELEERARAAVAEIQTDGGRSVQESGEKDSGDSGKSKESGGGGSGASAEQLKVAAGTELFAKQWEEGKHPRADDGKFGEGGTKKPKTKPRSRKPIPETVPLPSGFIEDNESTWKDAGFIAPDGSLLGKQGRHRDMLAKLGCTGRPGYEGNTAEIAGKYGLVRATTFGFKELSVQVFGRPLTRHQLEVIEDAVQRRPDLTLEVVDFKGKMKDWKMWKADPPTAQQIGQFINSTLGVDETESFSRCGIIHRYTLPHHAYRLLADQLNHRVKYNKDLQFVVEEPDKMTPTEANYRSGFGVVTCRGCDHYRDGGTCSEVSGDVRAFDVCDLWKSKRKAAS